MQQEEIDEIGSYLVIDTEVVDQAVFSNFAAKIYEVVVVSGGRVLMRGGEVEAVEGDWTTERLVIVAFERDQGAREFVRSAEYSASQELRSRAVRSKVSVAAELPTQRPAVKRSRGRGDGRLGHQAAPQRTVDTGGHVPNTRHGLAIDVDARPGLGSEVPQGGRCQSRQGRSVAWTSLERNGSEARCR